MDLADSLLDIHYITARSRSNTTSIRPSTNTLSTQPGRQMYASWHGKNGSQFLSLYSLKRQEEPEILTTSDQVDEQQTSTGSIKHKEIDGGTAWLCVLGAFITSFLIGGIEKSFGVIYVVIQQEYSISPVKASWIGSINSTLKFLLGVLGGILVRRFGCRYMTFLGATLYFSGILMSSFVKVPWILYMTYGLLPGVGGCLAYMSSSFITNERFNKLRARANGIALAGSGFGSFCLPIFIQYLLDHYGLFGEMIIMSAVAGNFFVAAALFFPIQQPEYQGEDNDIKLNEDDASSSDENNACVMRFRSFVAESCGCGNKNGDSENSLGVGFVTFCLSMCFVFMGYFASLFLLPVLARSKGVQASEAALLLSTIGISDMTGRIISGIVFDLKKCIPWRRHLYLFTFIIMSAVNLTLPFCIKYYQFLLCSVLCGFFAGCMVAQRAVICIEMIGPDLLQRYYGLLVTSQGVGVLVGPAIASTLKEQFNDYSTSYYFCCGAQVIAAIFFSIDLFYKCKGTASKKGEGH